MLVKYLDEIDILDAVRAESCSPLDIAWRDDQGNVIKKLISMNLEK